MSNRCTMIRNNIPKLASKQSEMVGTIGRRYQFKKLFQERSHLGRVWLATSDSSIISPPFVQL